MQSTTRGAVSGASRPANAHELALGPALVVEDQDPLREALCLTLEQHGLAVESCRDGQEALERLQMGLHPSLILLDLRTPRMSGWEFRLAQRENPLWRGIPVIALSADPSAKAAAIDATRFLQKPIERTALLEVVDDVLREAASNGASASTSRFGSQAEPPASTFGSQAEPPASTFGSQAEPPASTFGSQAEPPASTAALEEVLRPVATVLQCLSLAQTLTESLQSRLGKSDAFSLVGIRQLMARASTAAEHVCTLLDTRRAGVAELSHAPTRRNGSTSS